MTFRITFALATLVLTGAESWAPVAATQLSPRAIVEAKFAAVNRHDTAGIVRLYTPDARLFSSGFCEPRHGHGDVRRTYEDLFTTVKDLVADVHEYVVQGDRVVVRFTAKGQLSGRDVAVTIVNLFTVRSGLIEVDDGVYDTRGRQCTP